MSCILSASSFRGNYSLHESKGQKNAMSNLKGLSSFRYINCLPMF